MALVKLDFDPTPRKLRQFGAIAASLLFGLGLVAVLRGTFLGVQLTALSAHSAAWTLYIAAALVALTAVAFPRGLRPLFVALSIVATPIGFVLSYVLLAVMYFLIITPIGLAMRATGWDPMLRRRDPGARTYWKKRPSAPVASRYFNQY